MQIFHDNSRMIRMQKKKKTKGLKSKTLQAFLFSDNIWRSEQFWRRTQSKMNHTLSDLSFTMIRSKLS